jgi:hypothetical protein
MKTRFPTNRGPGFQYLNTCEEKGGNGPVRVVAAV